MKLPFRLGTTSYIYPADFITNTRKLAPVVDDIELVLFDTRDYGANYPTSAEISALHELSLEHELTFTVHLPMDLSSADDSLEKAKRAIEATRDLSPYAYIAHLDGRPLLGSPTREITDYWSRDSVQSINTLLTEIDDPRLLCLENLECWDPSHFDEIVPHTGISRCVDIGHLWLSGVDPLPYLCKHLEHTRVIHLHGVRELDHLSLNQMSPDQVQPIIEWLTREFSGVVTLEVFSEDHFFSSCQFLERLLVD